MELPEALMEVSDARQLSEPLGGASSSSTTTGQDEAGQKSLLASACVPSDEAPTALYPPPRGASEAALQRRAVGAQNAAPRRAAGEPPCSCARLRAGVRLRCSRFEQWTQACSARSRAPPGRYARLLEEASAGAVDGQTRRQVTLDVERTCPVLSFFQTGGGRDMLLNILNAWVVFDAASPSPVGYVQGMSFIAMNLLWHAGREEGAFLVFVAMMQHYGLQSMFEAPDMRGLKMRAFTVTQLVRMNMPDLSDHLAEYLQNSLELLLADWLLTLFASSVALGPLALLWDKFFETGYSAIYRSILARLRCLRPWLMKERDFTQLANLVRFAHVDFDRIEGSLVPRLRQQPSCSTPTSSFSVEKPSFFGRVALTAVSLLRPSGRGQWGSSGSASPALGRASANSVPSASCGHPAAWTCHVCNSGEDCESWRCIASELLELERAPADVIANFEQMYGLQEEDSSRRSDGEARGAAVASASAAAAAAPADAQDTGPSPSEASPAPERVDEDLATMNAKLSRENESLRVENARLQETVKELSETLVAVRRELLYAQGRAQAES